MSYRRRTNHQRNQNPMSGSLLSRFEKKKKKKKMDNEVDRISNLPEAIVHHILSFLDMKFVVQTCVLSTRWRYVWKTVSTLVFGVDAFGKTPHSVQISKVTRFIDKVLLLRGMFDIQKFHLHWVDDLFESYTIAELLEDHLNTWILVALSRNVQELLINIETSDNYDDLHLRFPHSLFNSQSLRKLVLDMTHKSESCVNLPKSMDLPRLKILSLSSFYTADVDLMNKLISSCPVLESLVLKDIWIENGDDMNLSIESRQLKYLTIIIDSEFCDPLYYVAKVIKLSTPNLISFICNTYMVQEYHLENLSSLVTANIQMTKDGNLEEGDLELSVEEKNKVYATRMMEFLRGFHNVKRLTVSTTDFVQVLGRYPDIIGAQSPPQFYNLRCLKLETGFTRSCLRAMIYLLKTCPSVEYLFLTAYEPDLPELDDDGELGLSSPCLMSHLKHIEITGFTSVQEESGNELKFLEVLLKNAIVLEKFVMSFNRTGSADRRKLMKNFKEKLRMLPRASLSLTMIFL